MVLRKLEIASQFWNCAATFEHSWNCTGFLGKSKVELHLLEGKAHPLGWAKKSWWAETHTFSPRTWTASCSSLLRDRSWAVVTWSSVPYLLRSFCHFDWHNTLAECFKTLSLIIDVSSSVHAISLLSIQKFRNCAAQFRNRIPLSKLVCNFVLSNLRSTILKLRKFANCTEHIYSAVHVLYCEHFGWMLNNIENKV